MSFVQVPPDSTGAKVDTYTMVDGGGNTIHRQAIVIADPLDASKSAGINEFGRLRVSTEPAAQDVVTGVITAVAQTVSLDVGRSGNITAMVSGTFTGFNAAFEASLDSTNGTDGTWFAIQLARTNSNTVEVVSGALNATPSYAWKASVNGYNWVRIRCTALTTGSVNVKINPSAYSTDPAPVTQSNAVSVSNISPATNAGSYTVSRVVISAAGTNLTSVKAAPGTIGSIHVSNSNLTTWAFVKIYNKASAPVLASDIPVQVYGVRPESSLMIAIPAIGYRLTTGIALAITGAAPNTDTTAVNANEVVVSMVYV